ncbi:MAG: magnesium transporter [Ignavibacteria bacterium]|jgi:flagellar motility protein MotE (MotC chaperone)/sporulation protein YlmC with PRC-barrel domain|nr:magnesium transporter [Ignavibacteria bacterium]MCU7502056.1 magnesium transporter [Ignavibacteria bacterium]MCU7515458.1 magnesium transporter [Ignavibacteria bacterium]
MQFISFDFSRILDLNIFSHDYQIIGKLKDVAVTNDVRNPRVRAAKVKTKDGIKFINWDYITLSKRHGQYHLSCTKLEEMPVEDLLMLNKQVMDKQIIDVNGRKVVRVNDIRLALLSAGMFVVAVDIGTEGLLRRLGIAKPIMKLGIKVPSKLILWNDVETVFSGSENIVLSKTYNKLSTLHPSDLADIIEDFDTKTGMTIFAHLDTARGADVLEEMEEETQVKVLENLATDKAADILEEMPADEVADILDGMDKERVEELLNNMEKEASDEVRELMEYDEKSVGSLMSNEFVSFRSDTSVGQVISTIREQKPEEGTTSYIYITNQKNKLIGKVSLRDIVISDPSVTLKSIMHKDIIFMYDNDEIEELIKIVTKYNLFAIPIVDKEMNLVGNVVINDIMYEILKER